MKVAIRKITVDDTDKIVAWRNNPNVLQFFIDQRPITSESHLSWLRNYVFTGQVEQFIIHVEDDNRDIGSVFLRDIDIDNKSGELGIFIGDDHYRGKGIGKLAVQKILDYAFNVLNLNKVFLRVLRDNPRAIASYEKSGFVRMDRKEQVEIHGEKKEVIFMECTIESVNLHLAENR